MAGPQRGDDVGRPADGERAAVVGISGQYRLAARIVLTKLATLKWIRVADPSAGVADDFQFKSSGARHAIQVKWSEYPTVFQWSELVNPSGQKPSLLRGLSRAWNRIRSDWDGPLELHLCTNEQPSGTAGPSGSPLADCTADGPHHLAAFVQQSFIPIQSQILGGAAWSEILSDPRFVPWQAAWDALRSESELDGPTFMRFIGELHLHFNMVLEDPLLTPREPEVESDLEHLASTIQALVADPARPLELSHSALLKRLHWSGRRQYRHAHSFPVPSVYATNETARVELEDRLSSLPGGYIGLIGPAGSGKSTLLASLSWPDDRVIRYYAFVPDAADPLSGRGEAESFLHDLSLALEDAGIYRQGFGNDLRSQRSVLTGQLERAGDLHLTDGGRTIIIVDGLDHIAREQNPSRSLVDELPAPAAIPDGVFFVLGTQTTAVLPTYVRNAIDGTERSIDLPPLRRDAVVRLAEAAGPGRWLLPGQIDSLVTASEGHPLALTYILQELVGLEAREPEGTARRHAADRLLADASGYGGQVEDRYRGYLLEVAADHEAMKMLGAVARLRGPLDLDWLAHWNDPARVSEFAARTATFFRAEGRTWRFVHNSFRRFLVDSTAEVAGGRSAGRDRAFHVELADACGASSGAWIQYRDEEIAHRYLAHQYEKVLEAASPARLREQLYQLRPSSVVRDHALLALRASAAIEDHSAFLRMLLFMNELAQRTMVLEADQLALALVDVRPERALEHLMAGGELRVSTATALEAATKLVAGANTESAAEVVRMVGGLRGIVERAGGTRDRDLADAVADWAEVTVHLSGMTEVLAQLDQHLPLPLDTDPRPTVSETDQATSHHERDWDEARAVARSCRNAALARCFDLSSDVRDDESLLVLSGIIDGEASPDWRARIRVVRAVASFEDGDHSAVYRWVRELAEIDDGTRRGPVDEDQDDEDEEEAPESARSHAVALHLRVLAAETLIRSGLSNVPEMTRLVPEDTAATWPSIPHSANGLEPFRTILDLERLRALRGFPTAPPRASELRGQGRQRFRLVLSLLARLEAQEVLATSGRGDPPSVGAMADPIIRLLEVPWRTSTDWTAWYAVPPAAPELNRRLIRVAARAGGATEVGKVFNKFVEAWSSTDRAEYWPPKARHAVIRATIDFGDDAARVAAREELLRVATQLETQSSEPYDQVDAWLSHARTCAEAGEDAYADAALRRAAEASLGVGIHRDDSQLVGWVDWLMAAGQDETLAREDLLSAVERYGVRLRNAAGDGHADRAAEELLTGLWRFESRNAARLADVLCDEGVLNEERALRAVLTGAARDSRISPALVAGAASELLIPILKDPSDAVAEALLNRDPLDGVIGALATMTRAEAIWSLVDDAPGDTSEEDSPPPDDPPSTVPAVTAHQLLVAMRKDEPPTGGWEPAAMQIVDQHVSQALALELLTQAQRLGFTGGALGSLAAVAGRAGAVEAARQALSDALARTRPYGWIRHYDGGTRLKLFQAALRFQQPEFRRLAANDLSGALSTGAISGPIAPGDLRRIADLLGGEGAAAAAWPDVEDYLDVLDSATGQLGRSSSEEVLRSASAPAGALIAYVSTFLGHPARIMDFGARRFMQVALTEYPDDAALVLAAAISALGGWRTEAALHAVATADAPIAGSSFEPLHIAISTCTASEDGICRDLARRIADHEDLEIADPPTRPIPDVLSLELPEPPTRSVPELDPEGVPYVDLHDPQQVVAPYDIFTRYMAKLAGLDGTALLHRASTIARDNSERWLVDGHRGQSALLKKRGQLQTYRPWALMVGRRAAGALLAELVDSGSLAGAPPLPAYALGLIDETLIRVEPQPLDASTPLPWRAPGVDGYDTRGWCSEVGGAADSVAASVTGHAPFVLAETSDWRSLASGRPEETRSIKTTFGRTPASPELWVQTPDPWEVTYLGPSSYLSTDLSDWDPTQTVLHARDSHSDPRWIDWLALHPGAARRLRWTPVDDKLFGWNGWDGEWRARTVRRARGQVSHQPPGTTCSGEVWQVLLSDTGLDEMIASFGGIERRAEVERLHPAKEREDRPDDEASTASAMIP